MRNRILPVIVTIITLLIALPASADSVVPHDGIWIDPFGQGYTSMGYPQGDGYAIVCAPLTAADLDESNVVCTPDVWIVDLEVFTSYPFAFEWGDGIWIVVQKIGNSPAFARAALIFDHNDQAHTGTFMLRGSHSASPPYSDVGTMLYDVPDSDQVLPSGPPPFNLDNGMFFDLYGA